jgi:hypothetical protein
MISFDNFGFDDYSLDPFVTAPKLEVSCLILGTRTADLPPA